MSTAILLTALVVSIQAYAQGQNMLQAIDNDRYSHSIDIKIHFPYDEANISPAYMENKHTLHLVDSLLRDTAYISTISKIDVIAQSSPEGSVGYNTRLSERRRVSLKEYFTTNYPQIDSMLWSFSAVAEDWDEFRSALVGAVDLPSREMVMDIVDGGRELDSKEWLLRTMDGGDTWRYIKERILPTQRFGASVLFIPNNPPIAMPMSFESLPFPLLSIPRAGQLQSDSSELLFALKSNLVLDAVTVINIAAEIPIGNRWSIVGEVVHPWWRSWGSNLTMQIESYHGELKYWLGERSRENQLTGWSIGLYGGFGRYDIQLFSEEGVQGDFFDIGAQISYSHPIAKRLYLEYALGLGYVSTQYNDYYMAYDTAEFDDIKVIPYPWMNSTLGSILPTRLGVSLVWHINTRVRGGKR